MGWIDAALFVALLLGIAAGGFMVARNPAFYVLLGQELLSIALPVVSKLVLKRMTPEQEASFQETMRRGQEWDHIRKRPRDR